MIALRRRARVACALIIGGLLAPLIFKVGAVPAQPGKPTMAAIIRLDSAAGFNLRGPDGARIYRGMRATFDFYRNKTAWGCVLSPSVQASEAVLEAIGDEALLAPLGSRIVHIDVLIGPARERGALLVAVEVRIPGQKAHRPAVATIPAARLGGDNTGRAIEGEAARLLGELLEKLSACTLKAKVRGRHNMRRAEGGVNLNFERSYNGDGTLALKADGSFRGEMTMPEAYVATLSAPNTTCRINETGGSCQIDRVTCAFTYERDTVTFEIGGQYRSEDDRLVVTSMNGKSVSRTRSWTCPALPMLSRMVVDPAASGDFIAQTGQLSLAFADGASVPIPPPPGVPGEWDVTLQIEYPGGTGATSRRPVRELARGR